MLFHVSIVNPLTCKCQKTDSVMRTFKYTAVAYKTLTLKYSTYYHFTHHKNFGSGGANHRSLQLNSNRPSIETSIHLSFFSVFLLHLCTKTLVTPSLFMMIYIALYQVPS